MFLITVSCRVLAWIVLGEEFVDYRVVPCERIELCFWTTVSCRVRAWVVMAEDVSCFLKECVLILVSCRVTAIVVSAEEICCSLYVGGRCFSSPCHAV